MSHKGTPGLNELRESEKMIPPKVSLSNKTNRVMDTIFQHSDNVSSYSLHGQLKLKQTQHDNYLGKFVSFFKYNKRLIALVPVVSFLR